jgi:hypothetical protein
LLRLSVTGRAEEQRIDEAEDGAIRADAEGKNNDGSGGEAPRFPELTERESEILDSERSGAKSKNPVMDRPTSSANRRDVSTALDMTLFFIRFAMRPSG